MSTLLLHLFLQIGEMPVPEDDPNAPPPDGVKLTVKLEHVQAGAEHRFGASGETDLPAGTRLKLRLFALDEVDFRGEKTLDEEPLVYDDPVTGARAYEGVELEGAKFELLLYACPKRPYSLPYRVRAYYDPDQQTKEIRERVGEKWFSVFADLRLGTDAELTSELASAAKELDADLRNVGDLYGELQAKFEEQKNQPDRETWAHWKTGWSARVEEVRKKNERRFDLWSVWLERQGKLRIEGFCDSFEKLIEDCTNHLDGDREALARAQVKMQSFTGRLEEAREAIGFDTPIHPAEVRTLFREFETPARQLEEIAQGGKRPDRWEEEVASLDRTACKTLLQLLPHLPRRGHTRVWNLHAAFLALLDGCRAKFSGAEPAPDLSPLVEAHRARLAEFRAYAGLK